MKRIYLEHTGEEFTAVDNDHHYLKNVLRMQEGDEVDVMSADSLTRAHIIAVTKRETIFSAIASRPLITPDYSLTVYQCLLKREYMDTVVEKFAELGATRIVPVISRRSLPSLKESALSRFIEIAKYAALQSEQEFIPGITDAVKINDIRAAADADNILFYERGVVQSPVLTSRAVQIVIGPEGGFEADEVELLHNKGFLSYTPLKSILKAATAAVVFCGLVRTQL